MDRLSREYKLEEGDPCSKLIETEPVKRLEGMKAIVQSYDEDKDSISTGLLEVKRNADSFLATIAPTSIERTDLNLERVECQVKEIQEQLRAQEQQVLDVWNVRRTLADYCLQYLELEQCAKKVGVAKHDLKSVHIKGLSYCEENSWEYFSEVEVASGRYLLSREVVR